MEIPLASVNIAGVVTSPAIKSRNMSTFEDIDFSMDMDPQPYLFEPEYTEEELLERERQARMAEQTGLDSSRRRAESNWWCNCAACQPMPTETESLCCTGWDQVLPSMARDEQPDGVACVTENPHFTAMLHPAVVDFFFRCDKVNWARRPIPDGADGQLSVELVSYRIIMEWALKGETLGRGNRKPLPSCVVCAIRRMYPSESGVYVGFQEAEDAMNIL